MMPAIENHFCYPQGKAKGSRRRINIDACIFLFRMMNARELTITLKAFNVVPALRYRHYLQTSGYILTQLKPFLHYCLWYKVIPGGSLEAIVAHRWGVRKEDRGLLALLLSSSKFMSRYNEFKPKFKSYPILQKAIPRVRMARSKNTKSKTGLKDKHMLHKPLRNPHEYKVLNNQVYIGLLPYCRNMAYKKLRFLEGTSRSREDNILELMYHGVHALYLSYPMWKSKLHALNISKRNVTNRGLNFISFHTSLGRQTKFENNDGTFSSNTKSRDAHDNPDSINLEMVQDAQRTVEEIRLLDILADREDLAEFRQIVFSEEADSRLTAHLKAGGMKLKARNNIEQYSWLLERGRGKQYLQSVATYCGVSLDFL